MNGTSRGITQRALAAVGMLILGLGTALIGLTSTAGGANAAPPQGKIEFCHYAGSNDNGGSGKWVLINTSVAAFYNAGHIDHSNDVFPAGSFDPPSPKVPMQSWSAQGDQSFITDGCESETPQPGEQRQTRTVEADPDCEANSVAFFEEERTRTVTEGQEPGPWSDWTKVDGSDDTRELTEEEAAACEELLVCPDDSDEPGLEYGPEDDPNEICYSDEQGIEECAPNVPLPSTDVNGDGKIDFRDCAAPGDGDGDNGNPGGDGDAEVLGIEANAPAAGVAAAAPTAVDAGVIAEQSGTDTSSWLMAGAALALMGAALGLAPARVRGKRVR